MASCLVPIALRSLSVKQIIKSFGLQMWSRAASGAVFERARANWPRIPPIKWTVDIDPPPSGRSGVNDRDAGAGKEECDGAEATRRTEQIIAKLREAEVELARGKTAGEVCPEARGHRADLLQSRARSGSPRKPCGAGGVGAAGGRSGADGARRSRRSGRSSTAGGRRSGGMPRSCTASSRCSASQAAICRSSAT
jgi:hypothetical protein